MTKKTTPMYITACTQEHHLHRLTATRECRRRTRAQHFYSIQFIFYLLLLLLLFFFSKSRLNNANQMYHRTYIRRWFCCCWCVFCVASTASSPRRYITACALAIDLNIGLCARTSIQIHKQHQHTTHSENAKSVFTYYMQTLLHCWIDCAAAIWNSSSIYGNFRYAFCVVKIAVFLL